MSSRDRARQTLKRAHRAERLVCESLGQKHDGRRGRADCIGVDEATEVKHQTTRPVGRAAVRQAVRLAKKEGKPRARVVDAGGVGFTSGARRAARRRGVELSTMIPEEQRRASPAPRQEPARDAGGWLPWLAGVATLVGGFALARSLKT